MDAEILAYEIERAGIAFTLERADCREAFLASLAGFQPDVILSDYTLPSFDGMTALRLARELAPATPFIVVTGSINEETAVRCMRAGAEDYLLKSNLARIGPAITAAVERQQSRVQRRSAEAALRRSEANLRAIFNNTPQDFVLLDRAGTVLACNRAQGECPRWLDGRSIRDGDCLPDLLPPGELGDEWRQLFADALENRAKTVERELSGERWFEISTVPVVDADSQVIGVCIGVLDIDGRKRTEEHLRRAERMQAVGRLAGGVAHEVNNMMTVILGSAGFLSSALPSDDPALADLRAITRAAERSAGVTQQLLAFSRQQVLQPQLLDINRVVADLESMLRRTLGAEHDLYLRLAPSPGPIRADRDQLEQVLVNLLLNARDAMSTGGRVTIETMPVVLGDEYLARHSAVRIPHGPYVLLSVTDTGTGIDAAAMARLFEPFFTTKPVGQGTGLGLSTVYGIVKQSGGFVWVYSEQGLGATFKVYLPLASEPAAGEAAPPLSPAVIRDGRGSESVLVVEDEPMLRQLTCRSLREFGYHVVEAANGASALATVEQMGTALDVVVSDVVMPGMSGREMGHRIRELRPELPMLFLSGYTGEDVVQRGLLDPEAAFLQKPFSPDVLCHRVRQLLDPPLTGPDPEAGPARQAALHRVR